MAPRTRSMVKLELASNSLGFARLPTELLHHILSYMQEAVIPWIYEGAMKHLYSKRRDILRTLCQLNRSLRAIFLPLLWERLGAYTYAVNDQKKVRGYKCDPSLANKLLSQLELVMNGKLRYAQHVRVVSVAVFKPDLADIILKKLAEALSLMPIVHTVQIICPSLLTSDTPRPLIGPGQFQKAFEGYIYPSVRRIAVPHQARTIFACFPEVQHVYINQQHVSLSYNFSDSVAEVAKHCHAVESFGWIEEAGGEYRVNSIVTMLPHLRRLECYIATGRLDPVMELSKLQNFEHVTLTFASDRRRCEEATQLIEAVRSMFAESKAPQRNKRLIVASKNDSIPASTYVF